MGSQNKSSDIVPMWKAVTIILVVIVGGVSLVGGIFFFALSGDGNVSLPSLGGNNSAVAGTSASAGTNTGANNTYSSYVEDAIQRLRGELLNPASLQVHQIRVRPETTSGVEVMLDFSAQIRAGGYDRRYASVFSEAGVTILPSNPTSQVDLMIRVNFLTDWAGATVYS